MDFITPAYLEALLPFIAVGFAAQLIDGALGMAFGVISNTLLVSVLGLAPARASAGVHLVEMFTTAASGLSHAFHRNIDWSLFSRLVIPGVIGGIGGAYILVHLDASITRPFVMAYLSIIGIMLFARSFGIPTQRKKPRFIAPLGLIGGFLDAAGGGGWGPVVTSNLLIQGTEPRRTIGTVNTAEFFLTVTVSITFIIGLGFEAFTVATMGLLIGGVAAAPLGALLAKRFPTMLLLRMVGVVLIATSLFSLYRALV
ncbi:sulfite exporter TauE/SafE family protein [Sphingomonas paeninsulae]|uniref:Probable membrane transporter protein n=1 Tax=Sphingomonas paeninsulae TaxID=2319844 RepID=A0A494TQI8_SPHPE|nr:sulfite exporter TauE/SafE family protein [Sphingomonas paeninsulae]AYJ88091.1 sulfite exporter TauE/SafE family protein [Sphingomonas paeninsulae]